MSLGNEIIKIKPREESGSKTSRKYSFQTDWSLYLLLRNHLKNDDYVFLFDFHEDLVVLNSSICPDKIDFYQIKSKDSGNWTINSLIKIDKDKKNSIFGKLYLNKINFPKETQSLNFISNARFSLKELKSNEDSKLKIEIKSSDFNSTDIKTCENALNLEFKSIDCSDFINYINLKVTKLSNIDSSTHCQGELSNLIHKLNPNNKINPKLAYIQISGELQKKTNTTTGDKNLNSLNELIELKGITKKQFIEFLESAGLYKSVEQEWEEVKSLIGENNLGAIELLNYRKSWRDVSMKLISDVDKIPLIKLKKEIEMVLDNTQKNNEISENTKILDILSLCLSKLSKSIYDDYFVKCLIIKVLYEKFQ